jgi:type II secretory pathway pseudopilin PulG
MAKRKRDSQGSFTLVETVLALGLLSAVVLELGSLHGNAIYFNEFERNSTQAVWLAQRVMSQVEYFWRSRPFKEIETKVENVPFEGYDDFQYNLSISEWKLPIIDLMTGGGGGGDEEESGDAEGAEGGGGDIIKEGINQILEGEPLLKIAFVEVSWAEGAKRNKVSLTYLLTNQNKFDEKIKILKPVYERLTKKTAPSPSPSPGAGGAGGAGGGATPAPTPSP